MCSCKNSLSNRQPAAVKQVVKWSAPRTNDIVASSAPKKPTSTVTAKTSVTRRRTVIRRPI